MQESWLPQLAYLYIPKRKKKPRENPDLDGEGSFKASENWNRSWQTLVEFEEEEEEKEEG